MKCETKYCPKSATEKRDDKLCSDCRRKKNQARKRQMRAKGNGLLKSEKTKNEELFKLVEDAKHMKEAYEEVVEDNEAKFEELESLSEFVDLDLVQENVNEIAKSRKISFPVEERAQNKPPPKKPPPKKPLPKKPPNPDVRSKRPRVQKESGQVQKESSQVQKESSQVQKESLPEAENEQPEDPMDVDDDFDKEDRRNKPPMKRLRKKTTSENNGVPFIDEESESENLQDLMDQVDKMEYDDFDLSKNKGRNLTLKKGPTDQEVTR